jgi:hypothetical protein
MDVGLPHATHPYPTTSEASYPSACARGDAVLFRCGQFLDKGQPPKPGLLASQEEQKSGQFLDKGHAPKCCCLHTKKSNVLRRSVSLSEEKSPRDHGCCLTSRTTIEISS